MANRIITDPKLDKLIEQQKEREFLTYSIRELCHLRRPIEQILEEIGEINTIFLYQVVAKFPAISVHAKEHVFDAAGYENLLINTTAFELEPELLKSLIKDCKFRVVNFARQGGVSDKAPQSARVRAAELMGKIRGMDIDEALERLDPEEAERIQKLGGLDNVQKY